VAVIKIDFQKHRNRAARLLHRTAFTDKPRGPPSPFPKSHLRPLFYYVLSKVAPAHLNTTFSNLPRLKVLNGTSYFSKNILSLQQHQFDFSKNHFALKIRQVLFRFSKNHFALKIRQVLF